MVYRKVLKWPDERLLETSEEVTTFDDDLCSLVGDMFDTLNVEMGAGIAAPQIGVQKRVVLVKCDSFDHKNEDPYEKNDNILVMINPTLKLGGDECTWQEACLSVPLVRGNVSRLRNAHVEYQDLQGNNRELSTGWPLSGAMQHECDHLDGILFLERMQRRESLKAKREIFNFLKKQAAIARKANKKEKLGSQSVKPKVRKAKAPKKFGKLKKKKK